MKIINLTKGYGVLVDDEDFEWLSKKSWYLIVQEDYMYVMGTPGKTKLMSRIILEHHGIDIQGKEVDHKNHNTLDNRKVNLRPCTPAQNRQNSIGHASRKCKYKGVTKKSNGKGFLAHISVNSKTKYLGIHKTQKLAALAYDKAAICYYGEFAYLNNVE